jgi:DNA-directed RNA polymerase alpha subunit
MTTRTANTLALEGIIDGEGVRRRSDSEFMRIPNFGRKSLNELHNWLNPSSETSTLAIARPPLATFSDEELLAELRHRLSRR